MSTKLLIVCWVKSDTFGHQVNSDSDDIVCFIFLLIGIKKN